MKRHEHTCRYIHIMMKENTYVFISKSSKYMPFWLILHFFLAFGPLKRPLKQWLGLMLQQQQNSSHLNDPCLDTNTWSYIYKSIMIGIRRVQTLWTKWHANDMLVNSYRHISSHQCLHLHRHGCTWRRTKKTTAMHLGCNWGMTVSVKLHVYIYINIIIWLCLYIHIM